MVLLVVNTRISANGKALMYTDYSEWCMKKKLLPQSYFKPDSCNTISIVIVHSGIDFLWSCIFLAVISV